jgi:hypothetical protein
MTSLAGFRRAAIFIPILPPHPATVGFESGLSRAKDRPPNRAFARAPNRLSDTLKYTQKIPFIQ